MQELFASPYMRINNTSDVTGVEICGALKNVLAIAAGIVEGLNLGNNAMAALVTQVEPLSCSPSASFAPQHLEQEILASPHCPHALLV